MSDALFEAKVQIISHFGNGPGVMIDDEHERLRRLTWLISMAEIEHEESAVTSLAVVKSSRIIPEPGSETIHASNARINWAALCERIRARPGSEATLIYDNHHTAVVTVARYRDKYPDLTFYTERREGTAGAVIVSN